MVKNEFLSTKEVAEILGVTEDCIRKWDKNGKLKPDYVSDGGHRKYNKRRIYEFKGGSGFKLLSWETIRKEWVDDMVRKLNKDWFSITTKLYEDKYPVLTIGTDDRDFSDNIILFPDRFENRSRYLLENNPNYCDGVYVTNVKEKYVRVIHGKKSNIPEEFIDDLDNIWFYLNWEFRYSEEAKNIYRDEISSNDFIDAIISCDFSGVFYEVNRVYDYSQKEHTSQKMFSIPTLYKDFISDFTKKLCTYVDMQRVWNDVPKYTERTRQTFKEGKYAYLNIEHMGYIFEYVLQDKTGDFLDIRIDDSEKFKYFIKLIKEKYPDAYCWSCSKSKNGIHISVDDIINNVKCKEDDSETRFESSLLTQKWAHRFIVKLPDEFKIEEWHIRKCTCPQYMYHGTITITTMYPVLIYKSHMYDKFDMSIEYLSEKGEVIGSYNLKECEIKKIWSSDLCYDTDNPVYGFIEIGYNTCDTENVGIVK